MAAVAQLVEPSVVVRVVVGSSPISRPISQTKYRFLHMAHIGHSEVEITLPHFSTPPHIAIIEARFYSNLNDMMIDGIKDVLNAVSASYEIITVPGALEIPAALQMLATRTFNPFNAFVTIGAVIRGETTHYDIVANESARGITDMVLKHNLAVGNGILTVENMEQALVRADKTRQNKGGGAAVAALTMLSLKQKCGA